MLTAEQIAALAPDAASAKAGRSVATLALWSACGVNEDAMWGECRGSGATPYRTQVEIAGGGYACSCPSRKVPCKHVLGLLFLAAAGEIARAEPPASIVTWLAQRQVKRARATAAKDDVTVAPRARANAAAIKRAAVREARVAAGLTELERWLGDLVRLGLARVRTEAPAFWNAQAARLVDAQAQGLARRVRHLGTLAASGDDFEVRMLDALGELYLLVEAYRRIESLPLARQADVRRHIGWTTRDEEVARRPGARVFDRWSVIGARTVAGDRVATHRVWLHGERTLRHALVLQFAVPGVSSSLAFFAAGSSFEGEIAYYDASVPQRATIVTHAESSECATLPHATGIDGALADFARDVATDPWLEATVATLAIAHTSRSGAVWFVEDGAGRTLPLAAAFDRTYALHALCAGRTLDVCGEWNGTAFFPLAATSNGRFAALG